jgi:hypothetical protein
MPPKIDSKLLAATVKGGSRHPGPLISNLEPRRQHLSKATAQGVFPKELQAVETSMITSTSLKLPAG